jgi:hypothetical protein
MIGEPYCQNTEFPLPVTVMLLHEPSRVTVFECPRISASWSLQVKVKVWPFPVTTIGSLFVGAVVGNGFEGTGVDVFDGGRVLVGS